MSPATYPPVGNTIQINLPIDDTTTGDPVDPTTLHAVVTAPDGVTQNFDFPDSTHFTRTETGEYVLSWLADKPGRWFWNVTATGTGQGVGDGYEDVRDLYSGPGVTLDVLKDYLSIQKTSEDDLLLRLLGSVTLMIERYIGVSLAPSPPFDSDGADSADPVTITVPVTGTASGQLRYFGTLATTPTWASGGALTVTIPHAREITDIKINQNTDSLAQVPIGDSGPGYWTSSDSRLPGNAARAITIVGVSDAVYSLQITGRFGIAPVPADITDAILTMTARRYKEREARWGDSVQLQDGAYVNYFRQFPLSVRATLDSYLELAA